MRAPVNSFEFHRCRRTPQVGCLTLSLGRLRQTQTASIHRLPRGLPGYLILFDTHAFELQRQLRYSRLPSQSEFFVISKHFTATRRIPPTSCALKSHSSRCNAQVEPPTFHNTLIRRPTLPLNPINPDNARTFRITAAAGTELAGPYS